jgi:YD repeat-containing protein
MAKSLGMVCFAIVAFTIAVGCAVAQAGEAYDAKGRLMGRGTFHSDGSHTYSSTDGRFSFHGFSRGNVAQTYDTNGRLAGFGTRRGNTTVTYDGSGRSTGRVVYNSSNSAWRVYDRRGRYVGSGSR